MSYADELAEARERAKIFVSGSRKNEKTGRTEPIPGGWHDQFSDHPWVRMAESEGWSRDLRSHLVFAKTRAIMAGKMPSVEDLMPTKQWVDGTRQKTARHTFGTLARPDRGLTAQTRRITGEHAE